MVSRYSSSETSFPVASTALVYSSTATLTMLESRLAEFSCAREAEEKTVRRVTVRRPVRIPEFIAE